MAARKRKTNSTSGTGAGSINANESNHKQDAKNEQKKQLDQKIANAKKEEVKELHFVPLFLQFSILLCSGALAVLSYRDMFGTGKVIFGTADEAMLQFTRSTQWFDDSRGWKSTQGGFSAVQQVTTDENDMGGFFVRKLAGSAALSFHLQKILPVVFQPTNSQWGLGHFNPVLITSVLGNLVIAVFYLSNIDDLIFADAGDMALGIIAALVVESIIILGYVLSVMLKKSVKVKAQKLPEGKTSRSLVSNILTRTVCIVSGLITVITGRDFFFPGYELHFPPYDDIYLEWTGAFIHSPPPNSIEREQYGLEAPLHIGDKFISRLAALYILVICVQKFVAAFLIRVGKDNSGSTKCKLFWRSQAISDGLILFTIRVFAAAAKSASLDFRWHVMCLGYEMFIFLVYGYL